VHGVVRPEKLDLLGGSEEAVQGVGGLLGFLFRENTQPLDSTTTIFL
jgi:hypothetical protein